MAGGGVSGKDGKITLRDSAGNDKIWLQGEVGSAILDGDLWAGPLLSAGVRVFQFAGDTGEFFITRKVGIEGHTIPAMQFRATPPFGAILVVGWKWQNGEIIVYDATKTDTIRLTGRTGTISVGAAGNNGKIIVRNRDGTERIHLDGQHGEIGLIRADGYQTMVLSASTGNIVSIGDVALRGADCAEEFDVEGSEKTEPGTVLVVGDDGNLRPCREPYDKKVVGVVSGGNGSNPGIILGKNPTENKRLPIALNGKVYCKVDAQFSPIEVGDLLTTSPTAGHAMRADDPLKAFGAVIGKALHPLKEGGGLIPILVALQ